MIIIINHKILFLKEKIQIKFVEKLKTIIKIMKSIIEIFYVESNSIK